MNTMNSVRLDFRIYIGANVFLQTFTETSKDKYM